MGIFSRFKDIVSSNISSMLDSAEDPEKLIRLMLREMEETLVELKSGCASTMAEGTRARKTLQEAEDETVQWERRAELALKAGREDMAREALAEKIQSAERVKLLSGEVIGFEELTHKCRDDIRLLEERITHTRDRQRLLTERHSQAQTRKQARKQISEADNFDSMKRFDALDHRITRMENEADLAWTGPVTKNKNFHELERDAAIADELDALREKVCAAKSSSGE